MRLLDTEAHYRHIAELSLQFPWTATASRGTISLRAWRENGQAVICVSDRGAGIPASISITSHHCS
jgi:hypothetical protein